MRTTPKKAKELAKEAGYTGTPIRLLVSTNYQAHYDEASVFTRQLADAGINVQMMVVDWATLLKMRGQPEQWDIFVTHHSLRSPTRCCSRSSMRAIPAGGTVPRSARFGPS